MLEATEDSGADGSESMFLLASSKVRSCMRIYRGQEEKLGPREVAPEAAPITMETESTPVCQLAPCYLSHIQEM